MDISSLSPGQSIYLTTDSPYYRDVYESTLLSMYEDTLEISIPFFNGFYIPVNAGFRLELKINTLFGPVEFYALVIKRDFTKHSLIIEPESIKHYEDKKTTGCSFITVTSGKGGVGKSVLSINLAAALVAKGKKVAVMDADLGMANIDVLLKLKVKANLMDVIGGSEKLTDIILEGPGGIRVIPGGSGFAELASLTPVQFNRIIEGFEALESEFDYVLIDTGAGLSGNITNFIYASDQTIVLTTPEPHAITDAYSIIKVVLDKKKSINLKFIINRCLSDDEGMDVYMRISQVVKKFMDYDIGLYGFLPESRTVTKSIREQSPFYFKYPSSDVSKSIKAIAERIISGEKIMLDKKEAGFLKKLVNLMAGH